MKLIQTNGLKGKSIHTQGHTMGDAPKRTSQGNGKRKRGSFRRSKPYKGQGK